MSETEKTMTSEEWISRCSACLCLIANIEQSVATEIAKGQLENINNDLSESPEDAARDEISYWVE